jgi:NLR family CARD domain-containing protein 3
MRGKEFLPHSMSSPATVLPKVVDIATIDAEATRLATLLQNDLDALAHDRPISACALTAPRRRSTKTSALASAVSAHLFPNYITEPLRALIQYEKAIVQLRAAFVAQEHAENERVRKENRTDTWSGRIEAQGPWDEINDPVSLEGAEALPSPVKISSEESLVSFFGYLAQGGDFDDRGNRVVQLEPHSEEPYIEFEKGVLYKDSRMDLCKVLVAFYRVNDCILIIIQGGGSPAYRDPPHCVADKLIRQALSVRK